VTGLTFFGLVAVTVVSLSSLRAAAWVDAES
jgi:hypothetical protein